MSTNAFSILVVNAAMEKTAGLPRYLENLRNSVASNSSGVSGNFTLGLRAAARSSFPGTALSAGRALDAVRDRVEAVHLGRELSRSQRELQTARATADETRHHMRMSDEERLGRGIAGTRDQLAERLAAQESGVMQRRNAIIRRQSRAEEIRRLSRGPSSNPVFAESAAQKPGIAAFLNDPYPVSELVPRGVAPTAAWHRNLMREARANRQPFETYAASLLRRGDDLRRFAPED